MEYTLTGILLEGDGIMVIELETQPVLKRVLNQLAGRKFNVRISQFFDKRSDRQNRYYHGVVIPTILSWHKECTGETLTKEDIHAFILEHIVNYEKEIKEVMGKTIITLKGPTTSSMNTKQFNEFKEKVQLHFGEQGCYIPDPIELYET